ncbi:hypothetical protein [Winogradskyella sp.]|uniref:hypothetical protein n=1 Tax=Winogradskyella sp. TaxID=1883156 RepID=UPI003BA8D5F2
MRTTLFNFMIKYILLVFVIIGYAQKPKIQLNMDIAEDTQIHLSFEDSLDDLKAKARDTLIKGLNEYIGFVNFTTEDAPDKLNVSLAKKIGSTGGFHDYWLYFELVDASGSISFHQTPLLDNDEIQGVLSRQDAFLNKFGHDWRDYLKMSYNNGLVKNLFHRVALNLSNNIPVIEEGGLKEALLPFRKEKLKMDARLSEFKVVVKLDLGDGRTTSREPKASFARFFDEDLKERFRAHDSLVGCILLGLENLPNITPVGGTVNITKYERKTFPNTASNVSEEFELD